jgi:tRNA nucleotidyltransferase (CCA-adding enzyme)
MHTKIITTLIKNGFEAYYVGGAVRDLIMNKKPKDWDIVTSATPTDIKYIFKDRNIKLVGESFKVVIVDGVEVATYRKDRYFGLSDKNVEISYAKTLEEDLARRDLTINAIAMTTSGKFIDPFNGIFDIKNKVIKFVGDPTERIYEDPCRILRAFRFCCLFDECSIDKDTFLALVKYSHLVSYISPERIRLELMKVLTYEKPSAFFVHLRNHKILLSIFPWLNNCYGFNGGDHHKETVWLHSMIAGDWLPKSKPLLRLAGYLHDVGKPYAWDGKNFLNHESVGAIRVETDLTKLKFSSEEIKYITALIREHMSFIAIVKPKGIRRMLVRFKKEGINWKDFILLKIADRNANLKKTNFKPKGIKFLVFKVYNQIKVKEQPFAVKDLAINGHDIMLWLDITPGPKVGEELNRLFELVLDSPELNTKKNLTQEIIKKYF